MIKTLILKMETVTLQPQTLISLTALIKSWNQDPLALNNSLIITKDTAIVMDGITILFFYNFL